MNLLNDTLNRLTVDELKSIGSSLPGMPKSGPKHTLLEFLRQQLSGNGLKATWQMLDDTQRLAVAEAVHEPLGRFSEQHFSAKHGRSPRFFNPPPEGSRLSQWDRWPGKHTALCLFLYRERDGSYQLPDDLGQELQAFVPEPAPAKVQVCDELPQQHQGHTLTVRACEREAMIDLAIVLRLADQGRIQVSDTTSLPSAGTLRLLADTLTGGDFYAEPQAGSPDPGKEPIGLIKAFAWPLLLQAAGLMQRQGSKSALTPAGRKALGAAPAGVLRTLWQKWLKATLLDEFSRVDVIKGQKAKGRVMTAVAPRRQAIETALKDCPVGAWIEVDQLSRYMMASGHEFEVTHDPWKLYILDAKYGSLGYDGSHGWNVLQLRYLLGLLFEYAAPLGLVDVAYVPPHEARDFGSDMWGTDDLPFLSRYDGLSHIRLTTLGAYCLGLADLYTPAAAPAFTRLSVMPSLQVHVAAGLLAVEEALMLDTWAAPLTDKSWQLDRQKALAAVESGHDTAELHAFLQARDEQPLPQPVEAFLAACQKQGRALRIAGTAVLVECQDAATAATLATHKETAGLCLAAGERHLVVRSEHQAKFRSAARVLGFGMPPG
jgi:hypothetical protein